MAQLTLYIDNETIKKVHSLAHKDHESVSAWVKKRILKTIQTQWPENYWDLFGSVQDESFRRPPQISFAKNVRHRT